MNHPVKLNIPPVAPPPCSISLADHSEQILEMVRVVEEEIATGQRNGNFALVTAAKLRRVVLTMDAEAVQAELLEGMGISAEVSALDGGIMLEVRTPHSLQTVMNALRSTFDVLGAMARNGRLAVKVIIPKYIKSHEN